MKTDFIKNVPLKVSLEVGNCELNVADIEKLFVGDVVKLDVYAGEPLRILVNGVCIGLAEVVVVDEKYGFRITELKGKDDERIK